jgi:fibronectin type 3 domain-containing protein
MENRKGTSFHIAMRPALLFPLFYFLFSVFLAACGAPGEPTPPAPVVPVAITDLTAKQDGDGVQLSFAMPLNSIAGARLATTPAVEILRGAVKPDGTPDLSSFRTVYAIPGALVENSRTDGRIRFTDSIAPEEIKAHPGRTIAYAVRTRASQKRPSADSNIVSLRVFPVPERVASVEVRVTESAIELSWTPPERTSTGDPVPALTGYRIYRSDMAPSATSSSAQLSPQGKADLPSSLLAATEASSYRDNSFSFGHTYVYIVRSVILADGNELESGASPPVTVTPRDTFPPIPPQGPVAVLLPGSAPGTYVVDLSWSISLETDLAGYRVYRSEQEGATGELLNPELLPTPAIRDTSVQPGHRYWYAVTAVDHAGNESAPSAPVAVEVAQPSS